jgi:hypothetical protein
MFFGVVNNQNVIYVTSVKWCFGVDKMFCMFIFKRLYEYLCNCSRDW